MDKNRPILYSHVAKTPTSMIAAPGQCLGARTREAMRRQQTGYNGPDAEAAAMAAKLAQLGGEPYIPRHKREASLLTAAKQLRVDIG